MQLTTSRNLDATAKSACCGHSINQSILVLLTKPGKFLHLVFNVSPTGDIANTICRLFAHLLTKYCHTPSRLGPRPTFSASGRIYRRSIMLKGLFLLACLASTIPRLTFVIAILMGHTNGDNKWQARDGMCKACWV